MSRCPRCESTYTGPPAISRADNKTEVCPDCGVVEAVEVFRGEVIAKTSRKKPSRIDDRTEAERRRAAERFVWREG